PLAPGENAECDSNFLSNASVRGESRQTDATHATVTITEIKVTLQLNINIWVPTGVTQHVIEHEEGHRQVSEYYYQTADKLAERASRSRRCAPVRRGQRRCSSVQKYIWIEKPSIVGWPLMEALGAAVTLGTPPRCTLTMPLIK